MGSYSIGEAVNLVVEKSQWKSKITELRLRAEWEQIMGKTISRYTRSLSLNGKELSIYTDIAPLKHELQTGKTQLIEKINQYFKDVVVNEIQVK